MRGRRFAFLLIPLALLLTGCDLTVAISGQGTVVSSPGDIDCTTGNSGTCTLSASGPATLGSLTATAADGWRFVRWSSAGTSSCGNHLLMGPFPGPPVDLTNPVCSGVMDDRAGATTMTAIFEEILPLISVTLDGSGTGTVTSDVDGIDCPEDCGHPWAEDTAVQLTAVADDGSSFGGWTDCPSANANSCVITVTEATTVTATFAAIPTYPLTVNLAGHGNGAVVSEDLELECEDDQCVIEVLEDAPVTLEAVAADGSVFEGWSGIFCDGTDVCEFTMSAAREVTAVFELLDDDEPEEPEAPHHADPAPKQRGCETGASGALCGLTKGDQTLDADDTGVEGLSVEIEGADGNGSVEVRRFAGSSEEAVLGQILELTASGLTFRRATVCLPAPQGEELEALGLRLADLLVVHDHEGDQARIAPSPSADGSRLCVRVGEFSRFWVTYPPRSLRSTDGGPAATAASWAVHAHGAGVGIVFLGSTNQSVDSLVAAAGMRGTNAALLLTDVDSLPAATRRALSRLAPGRVVVLGGPAAISDTVVAEVAALTGATVSRASGADRFATAAEISRLSRWEAVEHVYVVNGDTAADLPAVAAAAAHDGSAVVLTSGGTLPTPTIARLAELAPARVTIVGGRAAISEAVLAEVRTLTGAKVRRVAGSNRYATATAIMRGAYAGEQPVAYEADLGESGSTVAATVAAAASGALLLVTPPEGSAEAPRRLGTQHVIRFGPGPH